MKKLSWKTRKRSVKRFCIICAQKKKPKTLIFNVFLNDFEIKIDIKLILIITIINSSHY